MAGRLEQLVYRSVAAMPTEHLLPLAELLGEAQRNNERAGLTGALAVHGGRFLQVVEGEPGLLDQLQRRLERDRRHRDIDVLDRRPIPRRAFDGWSMASARITPSLVPELEQLLAETAPPADRIVGLMLEAMAPA